MVSQSAIHVAQKGAVWIYLVQFLSFVAAIMLIPYAKDFAAKYITQVFLQYAATYFVLFMAFMFVIPEVFYFLLSMLLKDKQ